MAIHRLTNSLKGRGGIFPHSRLYISLYFVLKELLMTQPPKSKRGEDIFVSFCYFKTIKSEKDKYLFRKAVMGR